MNKPQNCPLCGSERAAGTATFYRCLSKDVCDLVQEGGKGVIIQTPEQVGRVQQSDRCRIIMLEKQLAAKVGGLPLTFLSHVGPRRERVLVSGIYTQAPLDKECRGFMIQRIVKANGAVIDATAIEFTSLNEDAPRLEREGVAMADNLQSLLQGKD